VILQVSRTDAGFTVDLPHEIPRILHCYSHAGEKTLIYSSQRFAVIAQLMAERAGFSPSTSMTLMKSEIPQIITFDGQDPEITQEISANIFGLISDGG
jgi:hypothetical protein